MRALVYHESQREGVGGRPDSGALADSVAIGRVDATTICGTDLRILKGDVPPWPPVASSATRLSAPRAMGPGRVITGRRVGVGCGRRE